MRKFTESVATQFQAMGTPTEFAGGDIRESAAAAAAAQSALKAHGIAVSAWQHLNAAVEKAPPRLKNAGAQIRSKLLDIVDQIDEFYEALDELT